MASKPKANSSAPSAEREPVTARGLELLKMVYDNGGLYLTQDEAGDEVKAGNLVADLGNVQGNTAMVTLTKKGATLLAVEAANASNGGKSSFEIDDDVPLPAKTKKGAKRGSKYPFDVLEVGQSFHVPKTDETPDPVSALASSLTGARRRFSQPATDASGQPIMETVKVKTYELDASGKRVKGSDGKWIVTGEATEQRQKMNIVRDFSVVEVGSDDKRGPGARVFRTK